MPGVSTCQRAEDDEVGEVVAVAVRLFLEFELTTSLCSIQRIRTSMDTTASLAAFRRTVALAAHPYHFFASTVPPCSGSGRLKCLSAREVLQS